VLIGAVMALCFAYQFAVLLPHEGIGWQAHVGGLVGGILAGWLLRERRAAARAAKPATADAVSTKPGAAVTAADKSSKAGKTTGKGLAVDPSNPRADLYKQLDDMGL
jgi:hypothetical protein